MAFKHGKNAEFELGTDDLSAYSDNIEWTRNRDTGETTTFGLDDRTYVAGLRDGSFTVSGKFDSTATTGPRAVLTTAMQTDTAQVFAIRQEGSGTGLPEDTGSCLITSYVESIPVADVISWSADFQVSGTVTTGTQI